LWLGLRMGGDGLLQLQLQLQLPPRPLWSQLPGAGHCLRGQLQLWLGLRMGGGTDCSNRNCNCNYHLGRCGPNDQVPATA
jgi:hypothetical protein